MSLFKKSLYLITGVLVLDQIFKIWIKLNFAIGDEVLLFGEWGRLHFTENYGMAFGLSFGGEIGKVILTLFRLGAVALLLRWIYKLCKKEETLGVVLGLSAITAGAAGNIIDSLFYGLIFSESTPYSVAVLFPEAGGYASFFHGKVVDMLYFPVINTTLPSWFPFNAGEPFIFFSPIFNLADAAISVGVIYLILFKRAFFATERTESNYSEDNRSRNN